MKKKKRKTKEFNEIRHGTIADEKRRQKYVDRFFQIASNLRKFLQRHAIAVFLFEQGNESIL